MTAPATSKASATGRVLYQVVHLRDMDLDEWTPDFGQGPSDV